MAEIVGRLDAMRKNANYVGDRSRPRVIWDGDEATLRDSAVLIERLRQERDEAKKMLAVVLAQVGGVVVSGMTLRGVDWIGGRFVREESEHGGFLLRFDQGSSDPNIT